MKRKQLYLFLSVVLLFIVTYFLNSFFIEIYCVENKAFVWQFYYFISGVTAIMLLSLVLIFFFNNRYTGHTFIAWTMIKLMAVMAYFLIFVFERDITLERSVLFNIVSLYLVYLVYEVFFTVLLLKKSD